jgi:hypothetical protein
MKPIYKNATYIFYITIKVNDLPVDIRNDVVTVYISKVATLTPLVTKVADVTTDGLTGKAAVELSTTQTNLLAAGSYRLQALWELDGSTRKFLVTDTTVKVKSRII